MDAELTLRFTDTSLDPYVRFFEPRLSPFTTAIASGTIRVVGELADIAQLRRRRHGRAARAAAVRLPAAQRRADRDRTARSTSTSLESSGCGWSARARRSSWAATSNLHDSRCGRGARATRTSASCRASIRDIRSSGAAELQGGHQRAAEKPVFSGSATHRPTAASAISPLPHSLEAINGRSRSTPAACGSTACGPAGAAAM